MKRSTVIGILCFVFLAVTVFFAAYFTTYRQMRRNFVSTEDTMPKAETAGRQTVTNRQTEYVVELYDTQTNNITQATYQIPVDYIGCTREEIASLLEAYEKDPSIEDLESGFVDYSLVYFSPERIVLRKNFNSANAGYKYYIASERGMVTVFYVDKKTVYEYTSIETASLPNDVKLQVIQGIYMKDLSEVFDFLESHSS